MNFEKKMQKLEAIVAELENKSLSIDESLKLYNQAVLLAEDCIKEIKEGKGKLELLTENLNRINLDAESE